MKANLQTRKLAKRQFQLKKSRRRTLASLPVSEKIPILIRLQRLASEVQGATGRSHRRPWKLVSLTRRS